MITKLKQQSNGLLATLEDGTQVSIPEGYSGWLSEQIEAYTGTIEPEFTDAELAKQAQDKINSDSQAYLASTDWILQRKQEQDILGIASSLTNEEFSDILTKRQSARDSIKG